MGCAKLDIQVSQVPGMPSDREVRHKVAVVFEDLRFCLSECIEIGPNLTDV